MFDFFKQWRHGRALARAKERVQIDEALWFDTLTRFHFLEALAPGERARLRELVQLFLDQKEFATAHELPMTQNMRLSVACQACMLILNLGIEYYRGWSGIVLYPAQFRPRHTYMDPMGIMHQGEEVLSGEAWPGGPVILSWEDVEQGSRDGVNVVIHEFAHKLDMLNGAANGHPPLHPGMKQGVWANVFTQAYEDFCRWVDSGRYTPIDPYASEAPAEFFAVFSEAFFETPDIVKDIYPALYEQMSLFYRQDPGARVVAGG
ncbi:MAG: zinc-dependent peptidase [Burkholderiales bacterium]